MKLMVDTCTFLWLASADEMRSTNARALLEDSGNMLLLSTASVWEMGVKHALERLRLPNDLPPAGLIPEARPRNGVDTLPITEADALQLPKLPRTHQIRSTGCSSSGVGLGATTTPRASGRFRALCRTRVFLVCH